MTIDKYLEYYLTENQLKQIENIIGYERSSIYQNTSANNYLPRMNKDEIYLAFQNTIDKYFYNKQKIDSINNYINSCNSLNLSKDAIDSAMSFFNDKDIVFTIIPAQLEFKAKKLHKKYKKHIYKFANKIYTGEIKRQSNAIAYKLMPDFISYLDNKYNNKLIFV